MPLVIGFLKYFLWLLLGVICCTAHQYIEMPRAPMDENAWGRVLSMREAAIWTIGVLKGFVSFLFFVVLDLYARVQKWQRIQSSSMKVVLIISITTLVSILHRF